MVTGWDLNLSILEFLQKEAPGREGRPGIPDH